MACAISAMAALLIAVAPRTAAAFVVVTLAYTAAVGLCNATLTGMVLDVAGAGATATKMNVFFAMNTLFGLAMLRVDGAAHDRWGTSGMLLLEFAVGAVCLAMFVVVRRRAPKS